ncbi:MAG: histidine--tRNA ligase [Thermoproteota archaeon]|nr:histidine--tRNA ligase [Candidatus Brockarchaeota archaeon]MBO3768423.1 histidine--tRNA ligase [Candidatus Brockarchaeota archaeon]MBO3801382.1 histidine--tRNA ligase [Candidatus Brockarchaeota archaeon]
MSDIKKSIEPLRGFRELTPGEYEKKKFIIESISELFEKYGYREVETPTVEPLSLIELKIGEEIRHRMFRFKDLGDREVVLRPEGTISIARLVANKMRNEPLPIRVSYVENMFRYDEPQKGRYREFTHIGFEHFGSKSIVSDIEVINIAIEALKNIGVKEFRIKLGNEAILRKILNRANIEQKEQDLLLGMLDRGDNEEFFERLSKKGEKIIVNVFRELMKTKESSIGESEQILRKILADFPDALEEYERVKAIENFLEWKAKGKYYFDFGFARGLEYYTGIIFELYIPELNIAVGGGGRYDSLCKLFGRDLPAVGFALGVDRLMLSSQVKITKQRSKKVGVIILEEDEETIKYAFQVIDQLKEANISLEIDTMEGALSSKIERALRKNEEAIIIIGKKEQTEKQVSVKRLKDGIQKSFSYEELKEKTLDFIGQ